MPLYLSFHLFTSPTTLSPSSKSPNTPTTNLIIDPTKLRVLPLAVTLGAIVPSILACLPAPSIVSYSLQQDLVSFWQLFPVWISLSQLVLMTFSSFILPSKEQTYRSAAERNAVLLRSLRRTYIFIFAVSSLSHIASLTLSITPLILPSIFAPGYHSFFHPLRVFLPKSPLEITPISSLGEGALLLLQWDELIGSGAMIVWAMVLNRNAHAGKVTWGGWLSLLVKVTGLTAVTGPGGAVVALIWGRDELVLGDVGEVLEKKYL